jgi:hypothetical protein
MVGFIITTKTGEFTAQDLVFAGDVTWLDRLLWTSSPSAEIMIWVV